MQRYITTFRNMSRMDLHYSDNPGDKDNDDAMRNQYSEVPDADMTMAGDPGLSTNAPPSQSSQASPVIYDTI
jgi:hypothetical protein